MDTKETNLKTHTAKKYIDDSEYYKYIFKKTEKIVCALFYITRTDDSKDIKDQVITDIEESARTLLNVSINSLRQGMQTNSRAAFEIKLALVAFETKLRLASAAHVIGTEYLEVFVHEIDAVQRTLRKYLEESLSNPLFMHETPMSPKPHGSVVRKVKDQETALAPSVSRGVMVPTVSVGQTVLKSRRERVLDVIRDKGEASINDITDVIKDCSEKTIQRELINLISDSIIVREGERRWSKYKLA